jgi:hypothetical protein
MELGIRRKQFGGWQTLHAQLVRCSAAEIADINRLMQLFNQIQKHMKRINEAGIVEQARDLWKKIQVSRQ